jgi:hypothetical protein
LKQLGDYAPPSISNRSRYGAGEAVGETKCRVCLMKPLTAAIIGALIVALAVIGYLYYQRTQNDITISLPKIELKQ